MDGVNGVPERATNLQSKDHGQLLDVIDQLRAYGVDSHVPLPQLIVCGDQSSGKSSVLEAISGVRFPVKEGLCTRFPTEVILRRDAQEGSKVSIIPGEGRTEEEQAKLRQFQAASVLGGAFTSMVEEAKKAMDLTTESRKISDDVLRVEISGPKQPHLTLVDLPGVYHDGDGSEFVQELVYKYMDRKRSIILAVISGRNDLELQLVTKMTRRADPQGIRTLGVITKPDEIKQGAESGWLKLARNQRIPYRLGWHVLRNRDHAEQNCSTEERDRAEKEFFAKGVWTDLPASSLGIESLIPRLSNVLRDHILRGLPDLLRELADGIEDCKRTLGKLGMARSTPHDQQLHLIRVGEKFRSLVKEAKDGVYLDSFFGDVEIEDERNKRLRALVQNAMLEFAESIRQKGHRYEVRKDSASDSNSEFGDYESKFTAEVRTLIRDSRGRELPGTFNPLIIGDLFYRQSRQWKSLVNAHCKRILEATRRCLDLVLAATADERTQQGIVREIIAPVMVEIEAQLNTKIEEIMECHERGHPITYNHYFTDTIQKARPEYRKRVIETALDAYFAEHPKLASRQNIVPRDLLESVSRHIEVDMDKYTISEAIYCMDSYYKVAMKSLVDNVAILAIENVILSRLPTILTSEVVLGLDSAVVAEIACETEESQQERTRTEKKLSSLQEGLNVLQQFRLQANSGVALDPEERGGESSSGTEESEKEPASSGTEESEKEPASSGTAESEKKPVVTHSAEDDILWQWQSKKRGGDWGAWIDGET